MLCCSPTSSSTSLSKPHPLQPVFAVSPLCMFGCTFLISLILIKNTLRSCHILPGNLRSNASSHLPLPSLFFFLVHYHPSHPSDPIHREEQLVDKLQSKDFLTNWTTFLNTWGTFSRILYAIERRRFSDILTSTLFNGVTVIHFCMIFVKYCGVIAVEGVLHLNKFVLLCRSVSHIHNFKVLFSAIRAVIFISLHAKPSS